MRIKTRKSKPAMTRPAHDVTAWLATIPRRTPVWLVRHEDPLANEMGSHDGKSLPTRPAYMTRAERRAEARRVGESLIPGALRPYAKAKVSR